ncbi:Glutamate-gated chloride channel alpha [Armadillidium vulgare]|nr:Glutamate-gated chloride channel alpha [Armadillidium vulgare]
MLQKGLEDYVILSPIENGAKFHGVRKELQFYVRGPKHMMMINETREINWFEMRFDSLSSFYITNTYVPTLILLIIGYLPFYFFIEDFNERIVVSITSLLVEATFFSQLSNTVPKSAYMKLIDIWCLFCIVIIFCVSLLLTLINYLRKDKEVSRVKRLENFDLKQGFLKNIFTAENLNFLGQILIPLIVAIFSMAYMVIVSRIKE